MTEKEKKIQNFLMDWNITLQRIDQLEEEIKALEISMTPSYGLNGASGKPGGKSSKLENYYEQKEKKEGELKKKKERVDEIERVMSQPILSPKERSVIIYLMLGLNLSHYANTHHLYKSYVYKIKDRAIKKIAKNVRKNTF